MLFDSTTNTKANKTVLDNRLPAASSNDFRNHTLQPAVGGAPPVGGARPLTFDQKITMKKTPTVCALLFINLGIFVATVTLLPRRGSWGSSGPISYFINSRDRWDIAWGVLVSSIILSIGIFVLLYAKGVFEQKSSKIEQEVDLNT